MVTVYDPPSHLLCNFSFPRLKTCSKKFSIYMVCMSLDKKVSLLVCSAGLAFIFSMLQLVDLQPLLFPRQVNIIYTEKFYFSLR